MSDVPDRLAAALSDRYRIERELGQGGMATVYLAEDLKHKLLEAGAIPWRRFRAGRECLRGRDEPAGLELGRPLRRCDALTSLQ